MARPIRRPVDVQLKHWWEGDLDILTVSPSPVAEHDEHGASSTIGNRRSQGLLYHLRKFRYRMGYACACQWHLLKRRGLRSWLRANLG